ncbi:MAG TPA: chemotaxis protein CheW [Malonomonas sp.]
MDMRDKLFPIFLKETAKNLKILQDFLTAGGASSGAPVPIEDAFRSAHTLKGTARLVKVDSVYQIGRRIEALLEKHLTAKTRPTAVEREALELATGWLNHLLVDLQAGRSGSSALVADALAALDLASRFPGDTPLVELLDSAAQNRAPQLSDPFSADPELPLDAEEIMRTAKDPFADDPSFGFGFNFLPDPLANLSETVSPAQAAPLVSVADSDVASEQQPEPVVADPAAVPFDPFADDLSFLETEESLPRTKTENAEVFSVASSVDDPPAEELVESPPALPKPPAALPVDPFADDDFLDDDSAVLAPADSLPVAEEATPAQVKGIADWLLLPDDATMPEHLYVCCSFELSGRKYYLPIDDVLEIADMPPLLSLPLAPAPVYGLVNLRGQVLPVIDLSSLNQQSATSAAVRRLVVVEHQQEKLAFLADGIPYLSEDFVGEKIDLPTFIQSHKLKGVEE